MRSTWPSISLQKPDSDEWLASDIKCNLNFYFEDCQKLRSFYTKLD